MALSYSIIRRDTSGAMNQRVVDVTMDNAYPTGGWTISPRDMGFGQNGQVISVYGQTLIDGYRLQWDQANSKLKVFQDAGAAGPASELANASPVMLNKVARLVFSGLGHG